MTSNILVVGSINTDMVIKTSSLPKPGETVVGGNFFMNPGGKGANQAVAAARLGGNVTFAARVGNDVFGESAKENLRKENVDIQHITTDLHEPSGIALISVDSKGENCIVVAPGANNCMSGNDILNLKNDILRFDLILTQLEIPINSVEVLAELAYLKKKRLIINPAPASVLSHLILSSLYLITPNETEAEILTGVKVYDENTAQQASQLLKDKGVENVIITLGSKGAYLYCEQFKGIIPSEKVIAVDTTAAGDTFNGALAVALADGLSLEEAVKFGNKAAAISVTRLGAQASAPYRNEIR